MARKTRVGKDPTTATRQGTPGAHLFWRPKPDSNQKVKILVDVDQIISAEQFALWEFNPAPMWVEVENDPGHTLSGVKSRYTAWIPVALKDDDGEKVVKMWVVPKSLHTQIYDMAQELESSEGLIMSVKRSGSGIETRYTLIPTGKRETVTEELPDLKEFEEMLGPEDAEGVKKLIMEKSGMSSWDDVVAFYNGGGSSDGVDTL